MPDADTVTRPAGPRSLTMTQAAKILGVSRSSAYKESKLHGTVADVPTFVVAGARRVPTKSIADKLGVSSEELWADLELVKGVKQ